MEKTMLTMQSSAPRQPLAAVVMDRGQPRSGEVLALSSLPAYDPNAFAALKGTVSVSLTVNSAQSVNLLDPIRVLVNSREPDQRGTIVNSPGKLEIGRAHV